MNLSAWIDLQGLFVEIPLIVPFTPEGWTLPSIAATCVCAANIVPMIVVLLRWWQGKRFSEIPYIYMIISVGVIACCLLAMFWHKTVFIFGRERSVWLLSCIFVLSMLDCTSSLVFFDYMKRFRSEYLRAAFLRRSTDIGHPDHTDPCSGCSWRNHLYRAEQRHQYCQAYLYAAAFQCSDIHVFHCQYHCCIFDRFRAAQMDSYHRRCQRGRIRT